MYRMSSRTTKERFSESGMLIENPQGLKRKSSRPWLARLKRCPDTNPWLIAFAGEGARATHALVGQSLP
jgi:hypothetical protein